MNKQKINVVWFQSIENEVTTFNEHEYHNYDDDQ